jgi:hypothetical protein
MYCEHCPTDGSECAVCGGGEWDAPRRRYARAVAAACMCGLVVFIAVALICAAFNVTTAH